MSASRHPHTASARASVAATSWTHRPPVVPRSADKFGPAADYTAQSIQLLRALDELTALQDTAPLRVIDDDVSAAA